MNYLLRIMIMLFFLFSAGGVHAQTKSKRTIVRENYSNGKPSKVMVVRVTRSKFEDPSNYYKRTKVTTTYFDSISGHVTKKTVLITKLGESGPPCYEIFRKETLYDARGKKVRMEKQRCDRRRYVLKEYRNGKLVHVLIQRRRRVQVA
ncbi:MAG TPA: hypothetical protein VFU15_16750 [Bacteroidia bacterium]|nr:hypothetical protein [Bacteroidia bacterium]